MLILDQSPERLSSIFRSVINLLQRLGHRCVQSRVGSTVQRNHDRGTMEQPRIQTTHQHSRNESSPSGLQSFLTTQVKMPQHIGLQMDNSTAVAYVNKRGRTRSSTLAALAVEIWNVCQQKGIWITAQHLPGVQNVDADWASRHFNERTDSGQGDLHTYSHEVLHSTSRLVCISAQSSTTPLCFPAPRPGCNGGRCNDIALEHMDIVHSCANYNASSHSEEDTRRSGNLSTHCPELAGPDMVSATIDPLHMTSQRR